MSVLSDALGLLFADIGKRLAGAVITEAEAALEYSAAIAQLIPTPYEGYNRVIAVLGRVKGMLTGDGPPAASLGAVGASYLDVLNLAFYLPKTSSGWGAAINFGAYANGGDLINLYRNTEWQLLNGLGPGFDGNPANIQAHLDSFDTEQNWVPNGNLDAIAITHLAVSVNPSSGVVTVTATGNANVAYLYPGMGGDGSLIAFAGSAHTALKQSTMEVLTVNYTANTFTFQTPNGLIPTAGAVTTACRPVMRADMGAGSTHSSAGTGNGPDHWKKTPSAHIWVERFPAAGTVGMTGAPGFLSHLGPNDSRLLLFRPTNNGPNYFYQTAVNVRDLRGRQVTFGQYVDRVAAGTGRLVAVIDGVQTLGDTTVVANGKTWLEMTVTIPDGAMVIDTGFHAVDSANAPWRLSQPMFILGTHIGEGNYRPPPRGIEEPLLVKQTPDTYFGRSITFPPEGSAGLGYGVRVNVFAETGGAIAKDVKRIRGQLEAVSGGANRAISTRNTFNSNIRYGHIIHFADNGEKRGETGDFLLDDEGCFWFFTDVASAPYTGVSMDFDGVVLR